MNKRAIQKIREEATEIFGDEESREERVTYENYKRFTWTNAVIFEALRLHPSVPKVGPYPKLHEAVQRGVGLYKYL